MKFFAFLLSVCCALCTLNARELKVLMIGNSFSASVFRTLPKIVQAGKEHKLLLGNAYIGGCTLERHCANIDAEKSKPELKPYTFMLTGQEKSKAKLSDMLKAHKWDIVSIQQGSIHSPYKEKTQEYGKKLIAFIKTLAPQAEIVVHQTWAYRSDHPLFNKKGATLNRQKMHEMLTANYKELASANKLRMIPVGNAVQLFREKLPVRNVKYTPEDLKKLKKPAVIDITGGDVVGNMNWRKNPKGPGELLKIDRSHLNSGGAFMQCCVWYMFLFDAKASDIKLDSKHPNDKLFKECAEAALRQK